MIEIKLYSSTFFDTLSRCIFDNDKLERRHKLYLHTWFSKVEFEDPSQIMKMGINLASYLSTGEKGMFLLEAAATHPKMFDWFGKPLVGNEAVIEAIENIINTIDVPQKYIAHDFLMKIDEYLKKLEPANILSELLGASYSKDYLRLIICNDMPNPYNLYPDTVVHKKEDDKLWYIAGIGHEFGHILTWDLVNELRSMNMLNSVQTRMLPEMLAHICNKLLLDYYGYTVSDLISELLSWSEFGFSKTHPGMNLYKDLIDSINVDNAKSMREICIEKLSNYL